MSRFDRALIVDIGVDVNHDFGGTSCHDGLMSDDNTPQDGFTAIKDKLVDGAQTARETARDVWKNAVAPQLSDLGRRMREGGSKASVQAGDTFTDIGERLRKFGSRKDSDRSDE